MFPELFPRVLALAPHGDDVEFGCGGSLARFAESGAEIRIVVFSICEEWVPDGFPPDAVMTEVQASARVLGVPLDNLLFFRHRATDLWLNREAIFEILMTIRDDFKPDLVLAPSSDDLHQDHACVAIEAMRVFKRVTVLGYEMVWNSRQFPTTAFVQLEERHLEKKVQAIACYRSQGGKPYTSDEFIRSLARVRGLQVGARYAECFEVRRWVM